MYLKVDLLIVRLRDEPPKLLLQLGDGWLAAIKVLALELIRHARERVEGVLGWRVGESVFHAHSGLFALEINALGTAPIAFWDRFQWRSQAEYVEALRCESLTCTLSMATYLVALIAEQHQRLVITRSTELAQQRLNIDLIVRR